MQRVYLPFLILLLMLAACTGSATPNATEIALEPASALEQVYEGTLADGAQITIAYPAEWGIESSLPEMGLVFAFPAGLADLVTSDIAALTEADQIRVIVNFSPKDQLAATLGDVSAMGIVQSLLARISTPEGVIGTPQARTIEGRDAATVTLSNSDGSGDGYVVVIDAGDAYATVTSTFAAGQQRQHQATIEAMAVSANYTATAEAAG